MDASLFVNHIDPAFFAGILVGIGVTELVHLLKKYGEKQEKKKAKTNYEEVKRMFNEAL